MQQQQMHSILDGSPLALLYERDALTIFSYIFRRISVREDAEDILLEVFLAALESETLATKKNRAILCVSFLSEIFTSHMLKSLYLTC